MECIGLILGGKGEFFFSIVTFFLCTLLSKIKELGKYKILSIEIALHF